MPTSLSASRETIATTRQEPLLSETSQQFEMREAALATGVRALVLPAHVLAAALTTMSMSPGARPWFQLSAASPYVETAAAV